MIFRQTSLAGATIIEMERHFDDRGFFARSWCEKEFLEHGLDTRIVQCDVSYNHKKGTLRGMHLQIPPFAETKLVRCTRGALFDVIVDMRPESPTFTRWLGVGLTPENGTMLYVPKGFAHGFLTLEEETEVFYQMSEVYSPGHTRGFRWDDPAFSIEWPAAVRTISQRDQAWSSFRSIEEQLPK